MPAQLRSLSLSQLEVIRPRSVVHKGSFRPAAWRFVGCWLIVSFFALIYYFHPYYHRPFFSAFQAILINLYGWFCLVGFFYVWLTYYRRRQIRDDFSDAGLLALSLVRHSWRAIRSHSWLPWWRYWRSLRVKRLLLILGVKFFFVPLMIVFVAEHVTEAYRLWQQ